MGPPKYLSLRVSLMDWRSSRERNRTCWGPKPGGQVKGQMNCYHSPELTEPSSQSRGSRPVLCGPSRQKGGQGVNALGNKGQSRQSLSVVKLLSQGVTSRRRMTVIVDAVDETSGKGTQQEQTSEQLPTETPAEGFFS